DILLYINSPGGVVTAGLAIYATMQFANPDVATTCIWEAASVAAVLLAAWAHLQRAGGFGGRRLARSWGQRQAVLAPQLADPDPPALGPGSGGANDRHRYSRQGIAPNAGAAEPDPGAADGPAAQAYPG